MLHTETRPRILLAFWQYVKHHNLQVRCFGALFGSCRCTVVRHGMWDAEACIGAQDPDDRRYIALNAPLQEVFGAAAQDGQIQFSQISELLREHLSPPDPISIVYDVKLSGACT